MVRAETFGPMRTPMNMSDGCERVGMKPPSLAKDRSDQRRTLLGISLTSSQYPQWAENLFPQLFCLIIFARNSGFNSSDLSGLSLCAGSCHARGLRQFFQRH